MRIITKKKRREKKKQKTEKNKNNLNETINICCSICMLRLSSCGDEKRNKNQGKPRKKEIIEWFWWYVFESFVNVPTWKCFLKGISGNHFSIQMHCLRTLRITHICRFHSIMIFAIRPIETERTQPNARALIRVSLGFYYFFIRGKSKLQTLICSTTSGINYKKILKWMRSIKQ